MKLNEEHEIYVKAITAGLTAVSIIVSVLIFIWGERATLNREYQLIKEKDDLQYKRNLWIQQRNVYVKLSEVLGSFASDLDMNSKISSDSMIKFTSLYWGELILVESELISKQLTMLRNDVRDFANADIGKEKLLKRIKLILDECRQHVHKTINE